MMDLNVLWKRDFISQIVESKVIQFGDFTLKSGIKSPYFFNSGNFKDGYTLDMAARAYCKTILQSNIQFDAIFGPAYKGIPLACAVSLLLYQDYGKVYPYIFDRKEIKQHGEGGEFVGDTSIFEGDKLKRIIILDDVVTAGTAIRSTLTKLRSFKNISVSGVILCLDRQEKAIEGITHGNKCMNVLQKLEKELNIPIISVIKLDDICDYIATQSLDVGDQKQEYFETILTTVKKYRTDHCI